MTMAFGDKLACLWISDFHACPDTGPFDAMQASLLDTEGSLCLIDSNTDSEGGHVHGLEMLPRRIRASFAEGSSIPT
jgi:hypothetical protein